MKKTDFKPSKHCTICPHRQHAKEMLTLCDPFNVVYRWTCSVWGKTIECLSRADALAELHRQCRIEVAFARHARPLTMKEYFALDLKYEFRVDESEGKAYVNGVLYGQITQL